MAGNWNCSKKTLMTMQICTGFVYAVLQPKIFGNRVVFLTQIAKAMDYYFCFLYISEKYLQFKRRQKHLLEKTFTHSIQVNRSTYYRIFCIPQRYVQTSRSSLPKTKNFPKFAYNFLCEKVNFSLIHPTHITIHSL